MNIHLDYSNSSPMYEQIKEAIKGEIYSGKLKDQDPLPSIRQLAKELNVSMITTKRAYIDLEHEGFLYSVSGRGTFVKVPDLDKALTVRHEKLLEEHILAVTKLKEAGIEKAKVLKIIEDIYQEGNR